MSADHEVPPPLRSGRRCGRVRRGVKAAHRVQVRPVAQMFTRSVLLRALVPVQFSRETEFKDASPLRQASALDGIRPGGA